MSEWLSVKQKMPEEDDEILFVVSGKHHFEPFIRIGIRSYDGEHWWWCDEEGEFSEIGNDGDNSRVTHWMPLPELPVQKTDKEKM